MEIYITTTKADFVKEVNKIRLANKNKWVFIYADVDGVEVFIKNYGTYLQRYLVDHRRMESGRMGMSITTWKDELATGIAKAEMALAT